MRIEPYSEIRSYDVLKLIENFHSEALHEYQNGFDPKQVLSVLRNADHKNSFLLIINDRCEGILYGMVYESYLNESKTFQEVIWYVNESYRSKGGLLLRSVQHQLKDRGINSMIMVALENSMKDRLGMFYERMGFKPMETHYMRTL